MNEIPGLVLTGQETGVVPIAGTRPNEVWWAHECSSRSRWVYSGCPNHTLSGAVDDGNLTIRASLICEDCGKHGWITDMTWAEA